MLCRKFGGHHRVGVDDRRRRRTSRPSRCELLEQPAQREAFGAFRVVESLVDPRAERAGDRRGRVVAVVGDHADVEALARIVERAEARQQARRSRPLRCARDEHAKRRSPCAAGSARGRVDQRRGGQKQQVARASTTCAATSADEHAVSTAARRSAWSAVDATPTATGVGQRVAGASLSGGRVDQLAASARRIDRP